MVLEIANHYMVSDNLEYIIASSSNFELKLDVSYLARITVSGCFSS